MTIEIAKFGEFLMSRPAGREAWLAMKAYILKDLDEDEDIKVDFKGVKVLTPSWADEVITKLKQEFKNVSIVNGENSSVKASLEMIEQPVDSIENLNLELEA
jgi:hypothetical protein